MAIIHVNSENFNEEVLESAKTVIVDFFANWCGPCQMIAPVLEEIANEDANIDIAKIDVDESPELAIKYGINSIPALLVFKNGELTNTSIGFKSKAEILALL
ncbi:MAG: thioredoxin [Clostridia bacterium]|nr:thioredoxin [Clostridia bacterium]